jgi:hypothetical protein
MWRLAFLLLIIAIAAAMAAWLLTGKAVYKRWAIRLGKFGLVATLLVFGLLIVERLSS